MITAIREADLVLVYAGAGFSSENIFEGIEIGDYQTIKRELLLDGLTYEEIVSHDGYTKHFDTFHKFIKENAKVMLNSKPHVGYYNLFKLIKSKKHFIITTNVDDKFAQVGFNPELIYEMHGSYRYYQCRCGLYKWTDFGLKKCPNCGQNMRPNIALFEDRNFVKARALLQERNYKQFIENETKDCKKVVILVLGCGTLVPSLRQEVNDIRRKFNDHYTIYNVSLEDNNEFLGGNIVNVQMRCSQAF